VNNVISLDTRRNRDRKPEHTTYRVENAVYQMVFGTPKGAA